jgi:hypothetical protein
MSAFQQRRWNWPACGYVMLFNSQRLEPSDAKTLIQGMTEEEEAARDDG